MVSYGSVYETSNYIQDNLYIMTYSRSDTLT